MKSIKDIKDKIDWSKHEFKREFFEGELGEVKVFELSQPGTSIHRVRFTVSNGCTLVTGDLYRWSFEYDLSPFACDKPRVSESYLAGKLSRGAGATSWTRYDSHGTKDNINEILSQADEYEDDYIKDVKGLLKHVEDGETAVLSAIEESIYSSELYDLELIAHEYSWCFYMVVDAVREMCRRLWDESEWKNQ